MQFLSHKNLNTLQNFSFMFNDLQNNSYEKYWYENFYLITLHIYLSLSREKITFNTFVLNWYLILINTGPKKPGHENFYLVTLDIYLSLSRESHFNTFVLNWSLILIVTGRKNPVGCLKGYQKTQINLTRSNRCAKTLVSYKVNLVPYKYS